VALARRHDDRELEALAHHWLLYDLLELGDVTAAIESRRRLDELAPEVGQPLYRHSALVWQRVTEQMSGRFERAAQLAHEALNLARGAQGEAAQTHFIAQQLAIVPYQGGAARLLPAAEARATGGDTLWSAAVCLLRADRGERSPAAGAFDALTAERLADLPRNVFWLTTLAWLAEVCAAERDHGRAAVLYELLAPYGDRFVQLTFNGSFGCLHRHLGLLAAQLGTARRAAEHFEEAVRRHAVVRAPALEAWACCDYAHALIAGRAAGSTRDAKSMAERGLALAEACSATRLSARLRQLTPVATLQRR
jgi:hypothetical protein